MKPSPLISATAAALLAFGLALPAAGQGGTRPSTEAAKAASAPFTLLLLGTGHSDDVEVICKNLQAQPNVASLVPSVASRNHLEFSGRFTGERAELVTDVRGLAVDRYDVSVQDDAARGLVLILRKIREDVRAK